MRATRTDMERISFAANSHRAMKPRQATRVSDTFTSRASAYGRYTQYYGARRDSRYSLSIIVFKPGQNFRHSVPLLSPLIVNAAALEVGRIFVFFFFFLSSRSQYCPIVLMTLASRQASC